MKIYIAARYSRKEEMKEVVWALRNAGHIVTSKWMYEIDDPNVTLDQVETEMLQTYALTDVSEMRRAEAILFFAEDPLFGTPRGGRHVEFGIAVGSGKQLLVVGPKENIFHYLPAVRHFNNLQEVLDAI